MKDHLRDIVNENFSKEVNVNRLREYLQEYLLYILYRRKIYKELVFCGGTALRFLYKIRRFSEDLDFSLSEQLSSCDFEQILKSAHANYNKNRINIHSNNDTNDLNKKRIGAPKGHTGYTRIAPSKAGKTIRVPMRRKWTNEKLLH